MFASSLQDWMYKRVARPLFFKIDPETTHDMILSFGSLLGRTAPTRALCRILFTFEHPSLTQEILGIRFGDPVGLAAGFDKDARLTRILPAVGFGFEEVGSVTGEPCLGNPKPRLWRLPKSKGLIVYYGLKNEGCEAIARRLANERFGIPIGVSVAKTNCPATADTDVGIADYAKAMRAFVSVGDYFTVNISCPNAFGGEPFGTPERLDKLLTELDKIETAKPIFLKIAADISKEELDGLIAVADRHRVHGLVLTNLTKRRDHPELDQEEVKRSDKGGISGRVMQRLSNELIAHAYRTAGERYVIIGAGGIFSAEDAYEKIRAGASLVQLITGMIYEGPQLIGKINRGLVELMKRDGFASVKDAVGADHR